ncbi:MAG: hypothetical protein Q8P01_05360 [bacterium]|nr:hypothetical protein [bacterium]
MTQAIITTIRNTSIALPKTWKGARVLVRVRDNTATITKVPMSKNIFTESEMKSLRVLGAKVTKQMLGKAERAAHTER